MLYYFLYPLSEHYGWLNVFQYQTFRAMLAFLVAFVFVLVVQPLFIKWLQERGVKGQPIREDGPKGHEVKRGTPTMGGLVVILGVVTATILCADLRNERVWMALFVMISFTWLGFLDDWRKISKQNSAGLSEREKLCLQIGWSLVVVIMLLVTDFPTTLSVPFLKDIVIDLGFLGFTVFAVFVIVGTSNAVNFTDGLDGLAIGPVMTVAGTYAIFSYLAGHALISNYLGIHHEPGAGELSVMLAAILAGGLGFLWYNTFPAQVFMGDTGSMGLGGTLAFIAILVKQELVLVVAGGIFVVEALSVIIQRYYYKLTKKRVFRMAPIHHHFELLGWAEPKIIVRFWIISIVLAVVSLTTLKLR